MPELARLKAKMRAARRAAQDQLRKSGYLILPFDYSVPASFLAIRPHEQRIVKVAAGDLSPEELRQLAALCNWVVRLTTIEVWTRTDDGADFEIRRVL